MTVTFSDLHKESGLKALNDFLSGKSSISGDQLTKDDIKVYAAVLGEPSADLYPNASKWYGAISAKLAPSFPGKAVGVRIGGAAAAESAAPAEPWDDETDMKKLEEAVRSVELPGLFWEASKLVAVGYGIKKLQIMLTIVDDLVSVDTMIEEILTVEPINEYVQSCDIAAFNKI
ncbi:hypothetical protein ACS0TY_022853 [Phlomoides rotata]